MHKLEVRWSWVENEPDLATEYKCTELHHREAQHICVDGMSVSIKTGRQTSYITEGKLPSQDKLWHLPDTTESFCTTFKLVRFREHASVTCPLLRALLIARLWPNFVVQRRGRVGDCYADVAFTGVKDNSELVKLAQTGRLTLSCLRC